MVVLEERLVRGRDDRQAHVGQAEREELLDVRGLLALQLAVELERADEGGELAAFAEPHTAVPKQEPRALGVGRDDLRHAIRPPRRERGGQRRLEGLHRRALLQVQVLLRRRDA